MATGLFNWSRTPSSNANSTYNWAEGMAPSAVNDSARGDKADVAQWRDDIAGAIVTGGTSTAYTVTSYSTFTTLALMNGQVIAFTPHATNGATVTLNVDGLGAKPLRTAPSTELQAGVLIQGTPYTALYNNSDASWYLQGFYGSPFIVPLGAMLPYTGDTAPNSNFILPIGQAISRTTYAAYFAQVVTRFGSGDGSTTFNAPDMRQRTIFGGTMGGSDPGRLTSTYYGASVGNAVGSYGGLVVVGGGGSITLGQVNIPNYTLSNTLGVSRTGSVALSAAAGSVINGVTGTGANLTGGGGGLLSAAITVNDTQSFSVTGSVTSGGSGTPMSVVPPAMLVNFILRVL